MNPRIDERTAKSFNSRLKWVKLVNLKNICYHCNISQLTRCSFATLSTQLEPRYKIRLAQDLIKTTSQTRQNDLGSLLFYFFFNNYYSLHQYTLVSLLIFEKVSRAAWKLSQVYSHLLYLIIHLFRNPIPPPPCTIPHFCLLVNHISYINFHFSLVYLNRKYNTWGNLAGKCAERADISLTDFSVIRSIIRIFNQERKYALKYFCKRFRFKRRNIFLKARRKNINL